MAETSMSLVEPEEIPVADINPPLQAGKRSSLGSLHLRSHHLVEPEKDPMANIDQSLQAEKKSFLDLLRLHLRSNMALHLF